MSAKSKSKSKQKSHKDDEQPSGIFDKTNNIFLDKSHFILKDTCEETKIKSNKSFAILFVYVDWCPYCISAKDIIIDLRNELKKFNLKLYLANQTKDKYLSFVNSYPTIYFVDSDGFLEIMNTDRTVLSLFNLFINKIVNRMNPNAQIANKVEDILQQQQHMSIPNSLYNNSHAIQLTDNDLLYEDDQIKIKPEIFINPGLLKAYASWCIHCQVGSKKIKYLADKSKKAFPIIGVGGIHSAQDALEKIEAGADLVQIYTGFIYEGPSLVKRINKALLESTLKH